MSDKNYREFTLRFVKRTYDWFIVTQPVIKTEDNYETRVIEYQAYEDVKKKLDIATKAINLAYAESSWPFTKEVLRRALEDLELKEFKR